MSASSWTEAVPAVDVKSEEWSLATRVAFRFCFAFLLLANLPFPLNVVPGIDVDGYARQAWSGLIGLVDGPWFGVQADGAFNGSGDRIWHWIQLFLQVSIAAAATLVWSVADRRARSYPRLGHWLRVYVRFALAMVMISYGAMKVIPSQFPPPTLDRMIQPFGEASPMGLLWTFMGASTAYVVFTGMGEIIGGLLLTARRTTLAGALLCAGVMLHVVVLNFCYDVPVKIFSSLLLFQALFLIAPDAKRLFAFLFAGRERAAWWKVAIRTAAVVAFAGYALYGAQTSRKQWGDLAPRSPLRGVWTVDALTVDGVVQPPLLTSGERWRRMVFDGARGMSIQLVNDQRNRYSINLLGNEFTLGKRDDPKWKATFRYTRPEPQTLVVDGTMDGKRIHATMKLDAGREFLLNTRGFHGYRGLKRNLHKNRRLALLLALLPIFPTRLVAQTGTLGKGVVVRPLGSLLRLARSFLKGHDILNGTVFVRDFFIGKEYIVPYLKPLVIFIRFGFSAILLVFEE